MVSATDGWIVGEDRIMHWDGQTWSAVRRRWPMDLDYVLDVDMVSTTDGWIVGGIYWGEEGW